MARPRTHYLVTSTEPGAQIPDVHTICTGEPIALEEVAKLVKSEEGEQTQTFQVWKQLPIKITREVLVNVKVNGHRRKRRARIEGED